jgi:acetyl esterase/lipase
MEFPEGTEYLKPEIVRPRIDEISGIVYRQIRQMRRVDTLRMTVLIPRTDSPKPAILYFPGGGFTSADHEKFIEMRMALAEKGFVVAACQYRTIPARFPAPIEDAKHAIRFLRAHANEFSIDPARIGVLGDSAGGYVTQMLAATSHESGWDAGDYLDESSAVQAAVSIYGISDLRSIGEGLGQDAVHASCASTEALLLNGPAFRDFAGQGIGQDPEKALAASSIGHVTDKFPPILLMHGGRDTLVSPLQSINLYRTLKAQGLDARLVCLPGAAHGDLIWFQQPVVDLVSRWFAQKLQAGQGVPQSWR